MSGEYYARPVTMTDDRVREALEKQARQKALREQLDSQCAEHQGARATSGIYQDPPSSQPMTRAQRHRQRLAEEQRVDGMGGANPFVRPAMAPPAVMASPPQHPQTRGQNMPHTGDSVYNMTNMPVSRGGQNQFNSPPHHHQPQQQQQQQQQQQYYAMAPDGTFNNLPQHGRMPTPPSQPQDVRSNGATDGRGFQWQQQHQQQQPPPPPPPPQQQQQQQHYQQPPPAQEHNVSGSMAGMAHGGTSNEFYDMLNRATEKVVEQKLAARGMNDTLNAPPSAQGRPAVALLPRADPQRRVPSRQPGKRSNSSVTGGARDAVEQQQVLQTELDQQRQQMMKLRAKEKEWETQVRGLKNDLRHAAHKEKELTTAMHKRKQSKQRAETAPIPKPPSQLPKVVTTRKPGVPKVKVQLQAISSDEPAMGGSIANGTGAKKRAGNMSLRPITAPLEPLYAEPTSGSLPPLPEALRSGYKTNAFSSIPSARGAPAPMSARDIAAAQVSPQSYQLSYAQLLQFAEARVITHRQVQQLWELFSAGNGTQRPDARTLPARSLSGDVPGAMQSYETYEDLIDDDDDDDDDDGY
jgi:hypothetical protein